MINYVSSNIWSGVKGRPLQILTFPTHERNQSLFQNINANFWMFRTNGVKNWDEKYAPIPQNHYLLPHDTLPSWVDFNCLLSQNKAGQFQLCKQMQYNIYLPIISLEHTLPPPETTKEQIQEWKSFFNADVNVFITDFNRQAWGYSSEEAVVIPHALDTNLFSPDNRIRQNKILTVANDYINRDYVLNFSQYQRVTAGLPVMPVGDTPGFSKPAKSVEELVDFYRGHRIFLNTAHWSPVPMSLLEAMSCGCAVVSCKTCAIPEFIYHGYNGLLAENDEEMRECLLSLLKDPSLAVKLGRNARDTIQTKCSLKEFSKNWEKVFERF